MRVRAARGAIVVDRDEPEIAVRRHRAAARIRARAQRDRAGGPDQRPVHGHRRSPLGVPCGSRSPDGTGTGAADVRPRDPGRGFDAVGDPAPGPLPLGAGPSIRWCTSTSTARSRYAMTSIDPERIAVVGTGLIGTSIAMASSRVGCDVVGWDPIRRRWRSRPNGVRPRRASVEDAVAGAAIVIICAPVPVIPALAARALAAAPDAIVTDAGSIKEHVVREVAGLAGPAARRFVGGHPMGGSERSGPEHASASVVDGIVWVLTPDDDADPLAVAALEAWVGRIGGRPVRMSPARHDRLVAFVSHLPQVASTALMGLAATEEADEPDILLLAAGGFRDLTRLASSNPALWSQILLVEPRGDRRGDRPLRGPALRTSATMVARGPRERVERTFDGAKQARLRLAAKPQVRAGVAVLQVQAPDRPGALARAHVRPRGAEVNIEDLQIVHSPEGGRGTVHLTVAAPAAVDDALRRARRAGRFDPDPAGLRSCVRIRVIPGGTLRGECRVPGDKSIAHRWLILARHRARSQPSGTGSGFPRRSLDRFVPRDGVRACSTFTRGLGSERCRPSTEGHGSTWNEGDAETGRRALEVEGEGRAALTAAAGTTRLRQLRHHDAAARRDARRRAVPHRAHRRSRACRARPMERVAEPLRAMGAGVDDRRTATPRSMWTEDRSRRSDHACAPHRAGEERRAAGRHRGRGGDDVTEPAATRDHTERALAALGAPVSVDGTTSRSGAYPARGFRGDRAGRSSRPRRSWSPPPRSPARS